MAKKAGGGGKTGKGGGTNAPQKSPSITGGRRVPKAVSAGKAVAGPGAKGKGGKKNPHAGEVYNPGEKNPTISPYMTGEDIMAYSQARSQYAQQLNELDFNYEQSQINTQREKEATTKKEGYDLSEARNDFAARGLQRSSIRDADLFDINAAAEMKKTALDTNLNALKIHTDTEKERLRQAWEDPETGYLHGLDLKKVANAQAAGAEMGEWAKEPGWEKKPGAPGGTKPPAKPKKGPAFARGAPVPNPSLPPTRPTHSGGTQAPIHSPAVNTGHGARQIRGKNYG